MSRGRHETCHRLAGFQDRFRPHPVDGPLLYFERHGFRLEYLASSERHWVRVVFDRLDAHRLCRGEYPPYPWVRGVAFSPIAIVRPSSWLAERYAYEKRHYGMSYGFSGDVDEMLHEFDHYLFSFHDEFLEVIAGGVHFEAIDRPGQVDIPTHRLGWGRLDNGLDPETIGDNERRLFVRRSDVAEEVMLEASNLSDQVLLQVDTEPTTTSVPALRLTVRTRNGQVVSRLRQSFGSVLETYDGIPAADTVLARIDQWNTERVERLRRRRSTS